MVLLAIGSAMVAPSMASFYRGRMLSSEAKRVLALVHYGQSRAIAEGGVYLNNIKIEDEAAQIDSWLSGRFAVLRRGKKTLAGIFKG